MQPSRSEKGTRCLLCLWHPDEQVVWATPRALQTSAIGRKRRVTQSLRNSNSSNDSGRIVML